jgi:hypothetical protein
MGQPVETRRREKATDKADAKPEMLARNSQSAASDTAGSAGFVATADLSRKQEVAAQPADELRAKSESQVAQPQAPQAAPPAAQVARNEAQQTKQQPSAEKDSVQQIPEPKPRADKESAEKEKTRQAEEAAAPPPSSDPSRDRSLKRPASKLALRDPNTGETARLDERKVGGKKFFFRGGAWTDKDYDPDKDLPIVTVIRDSNVYKELLSKRSGLRPIMERFTATERAIIVYKGTVYKLIPQ